MTEKADITTFVLNWITTNGGTPVQDHATFEAAGIDSLDLVELTMDLEERYEVNLEKVELEMGMTVARLVSEVEVRR